MEVEGASSRILVRRIGLFIYFCGRCNTDNAFSFVFNGRHETSPLEDRIFRHTKARNIWLAICAGLVGTKLCAGRVWSISTLHVGPDQPDPRPIPHPNPNLNLNFGGIEVGRGSHAAPPRVLMEFSNKPPGGRKASLDQYIRLKYSRAAERPASTNT